MQGLFKRGSSWLQRLLQGAQLPQRAGAYQGVVAMGGSLIMLVAVIVGLVWPLWQEHRVRQQEMQLKERQLELWTSFAKKHADYEGLLAQAQQRQAQLRKQLPEQLEVAETLAGLQRLAAQTQVVLIASQAPAARVSTVKDLQCRVLELKASGTYSSCLGFLAGLEKEGLTGLEQLQVEADRQGLLTLRGKYWQYALK